MGWFRQLFSRRHRYDELSETIREHLDEKIADLMDRGLTREDAARTARREFGNVTRIEEHSREVWQWRKMEAIRADVKYALRQLVKHPGFTFTAILTLALGIGANVVVFSVLNALILRPLNVPNPKSLWLVEHKERDSYYQSYPDYLDYRDRNLTFEGLGAYDPVSAGVSTGKTPRREFGYLASGNYFDVLGVRPVLGHFFHAKAMHGIGSAPYVVLSFDFWQGYFNGNPDIIGTTIDIDKQSFTVMGIAPRGFHGTETFYWPSFWVPIVEATQLGNGATFLDNRSNHNFWMFGRLKIGITPQQASDDLNAISQQLTAEYPTADYGLNARLVRPGLMGDRAAHGFLGGIMVLAVLVLLAACANLGSVFAARVADRKRELAIRLAIGSSRRAVLRGLLTEAILISAMGGSVGTILAAFLLQVFSRWRPLADLPFHVAVNPDAKVYALALLLSLGSGIFFGLLPAHQIKESDTAQIMKSGAGAKVVFRKFTLRDILLSIQITLCTLLITASLVALRGMERSLHAPLGFRPKGVMLASTDLTMAGYREDDFLPVRKRMLEETASIPGVQAVGIIDRNLLGDDCCGMESVFHMGTTDFRKDVLIALNFSISPGYLRAAGTRLLAGRGFTWHDTAKSPPVALVNEAFARMMFGNKPAVGQHFLLYRGTHPKEIVGVVENGKYQSLTEESQPAMFFPLAQEVNNNDTTLVVRSVLSQPQITRALYRTLSGINSSLPLTVRSWPEELGFALFPARAATAALGIMGFLAAMLALTGIFGMATYSVSKRMKELGIRVALGAAHMQLLGSALARPLILLLTGSVAGLLLGVFASRFLAQIVYEATPRDPLVLGGVILAMSVLARVYRPEQI